jgi:deazaflavin-dependent oxidoreductase (nitroreductase family)
MPAPRRIARFNKHFTNRLSLKVAGYLPGFAIVSHVGRKSGRPYRTPVNAFRTDGGYIIALTYGAQSDWVKNVLAAGSCELQTRGAAGSPLRPHYRHRREQGLGSAPCEAHPGSHRRSPVHAALHSTPKTGNGHRTGERNPGTSAVSSVVFPL